MRRFFSGDRATAVQRWQRHRLPMLVLLVLAVLTFHGLPGHSFLVNWDDQIYVTGNPAVRGLTLQHLHMAFTSYYVGNYAPLQIVSYMLDYSLWGLKAHGFLLANIAYHLLCSLLLYLLLVRQGFARWGALLGAALFMVHPVQMESVAWVSQRKNLLAMLFFLLAWHAWLNWRRGSGRRAGGWYGVALVLFVLALLAKSVAVIFPLMLVLHDLLITPSRRGLRHQWDKLPFLLAAAGVAVLALITQSADNGGGRIPYPDHPLTLPLTMPTVLGRYLGLLVWPLPSRLSVVYYPPLRTALDPAVVAGLLLVLLLVLVGIWLQRRDRPALFWYSLFFVGLLPVSQAVPLVTLMNDRYLYFPMLGVAGLAACLTTRLADGRRRWGMAAGGVLLLGLALLAHQRGRVWQDTITLFGDAVAKEPRHPDPWSRLAEGYVFKGSLGQARQYYERGASLGTLDHDAQYNLARIYLELGDRQRAYTHIWRLLLHNDRFREGRLLLGEFQYREGAYQEALQQFQAYLEENPAGVHGWYMLGRTHLMLGQLPAAGEALSQAASAGGRSAGLFLAMARLESLEGDRERALEHLQAALELNLPVAEWQEGEPQLRNISDTSLYLSLVAPYLARHSLGGRHAQ